MEIKVRFHGVRVINGVAVEVSSNELVTPDAKAIRHMELVTPDAQVTKNILAGADSDRNGSLTFEEVSAFPGQRIQPVG